MEANILQCMQNGQLVPVSPKDGEERELVGRVHGFGGSAPVAAAAEKKRGSKKGKGLLPKSLTPTSGPI